MSPSYNRRFLRCEPIEGIWAEVYALPGAMKPLGYEPLALLYRDNWYTPDGMLIATPGGLMHWHGGAVRSIDQRKAKAALEAMARRQAQKERGEKTESAVEEADRLTEEGDDDAGE